MSIGVLVLLGFTVPAWAQADKPAPSPPTTPVAETPPAKPAAAAKPDAPAKEANPYAKDFDTWYILELGGQRAGWMHNAQKTEGDIIRTTGELVISLARADNPIQMTVTTEFVETTAGKPQTIMVDQRMGGTPVVLRGAYGEEEINISLDGGIMKTSRREPVPEGKWFPPAAANAEFRKQFAAKAPVIEIRTPQLAGGMDPMSALTVQTTRREKFEPAEIEVGGKKLKVTRCVATSSAAPGIESAEFIDDEGTTVASETKLGAIVMRTRLGTEAEVKAMPKTEAGAPKVPEIMLSTFVKPDRPIPNPRGSTKAVYVLSVDEGQMPMLPNTATQKVERIDSQSVRVTVDVKGVTAAPKDDVFNQNYRKDSSLLQVLDPVVVELGKESLKGAPDPVLQRAEIMRKFVSKYITTKSLGVAFGSAAEVARSKEGDCTEHAVLLAALLRADLMSSRVASGLIYAEEFAGEKDVFAYHMWSQVLLAPTPLPAWIDLDATLKGDRPFDATHICLGTSALADGEPPMGFITLTQLLGRVRIKVESVE